MRCPDELTLDLWSAGALPAQEADALAIHIAVCASCTARLAQQQAATNELGAALQLDHDELAYLDSLQLRTAWRSPAHTAAPQHLGRLALFAVVTAFLAWTLAAHARTTSIFAALLAVCCMALALPGGALAAEVRGGQTVVVSSGETVDDDLFFGGGQTATISGHVTGDAYAVAQTVVVTGTVDGDLIAAGREVIVDGTISGNVRAAGATITVNGTVGRSLTGAAQQVNISPNGHVGGSVVAAAETISQFGPIGRGMTVGGGAVQLAGPVGGPVLARVETLSVAPTARLASGLDYQAKQEATLPPGTVNGSLQFSPPPQRPEQPAPPLNGLFDLGGLVALVGSFLVGALALVLAPRASARAIELGRQQPWPSFGLGTLALIGVPIGCMLLALTLVGLPTSVGLFALYIVSLLLAWPAVGLLLGTWLVRLVRPSRQLAPLGTLALGLIALHLATHLLFIGGVIGVCALILGLGLVLRGVRGSQSPTSLAHAVAAVPVAA